jgi:hypothetical protein
LDVPHNEVSLSIEQPRVREVGAINRHSFTRNISSLPSHVFGSFLHSSSQVAELCTQPKATANEKRL